MFNEEGVWSRLYRLGTEIRHRNAQSTINGLTCGQTSGNYVISGMFNRDSAAARTKVGGIWQDSGSPSGY